MAYKISSRAWGTKISPDDATQTPVSEDAVSWGDAARTGTAFDFRSEFKAQYPFATFSNRL
jgi:hypothetical protein